MLDRTLEPEFMDTPEEALDYDAMGHGDVNRAFVADLRIAAAMVLNSPCDSPIEVLDLGTGTALQPIELCQQCPNVRVVAVDAAANMLDVARINIEIARQTNRIMLQLIDAKHTPFEDGRFPIVMSNSIIHHIPEPIDVLREALRIAKLGGILFFRDLMRPESELALAEIVGLYTAEATEHQRQMFADSLRAALSLDEIRHWIERLGFPPETVQATSDRHWTWTGWKEP